MGFSIPNHGKSAESGYYAKDAGGGVLYEDRFEADCAVVVTTTWQPPSAFGDYSLVYDVGNPVRCCCQL